MSPSDPEDALVPHAVGVDVLDAALYHQRNLLSCRLKILVKRASKYCGQPSCLGLHLLPETRNSSFIHICHQSWSQKKEKHLKKIFNQLPLVTALIG